MSNVIDNRVVKMDFDNGNFERNAKTSLSTLDKLKNALNFDGMSNSLSELSKSASRFNMYGVETASDTVKEKFSAMEVIAVGALLRIGQQAVDAGEKLIKSMSTDQIMAGWDKFAKKTTSTATLIGQGFDMTTVDEQLKRLNWFTDETSYNFTDMVDSIGKFTASGKGLEESVTAMEGIANWAALSGQNATTASRAMYQISQAMGAGVMRKEDYKSIQNAAMDTDEFRQKALDAAVAMGTLKKNSDGTYKSLVATSTKGKEAFSKSQFADHLTEGLWLTDEVMMKVFNDYSAGLGQINEFMENFGEENDMLTSQVIRAKEEFDKGGKAFDEYADSLDLDPEVKEGLRDLVSNLDNFGVKAFGAAQKARTFGDAIDSVKDAASTTWMNIFELFIGNAEQATEVWTDLANYLWDVFVGPLNDLKDFFDGLLNGAEGNRDKFIGVFRKIAEVASKITKPISDAFELIFPKKEAEELGQNFSIIIDKITTFLDHLKPTEVESEKLKNTFAGLFSLLKIGSSVLKTVISASSPALGILRKALNLILDITSGIGLAIQGIYESGNAVNKINKIINIVKYNINNLIGVLKWTIELFLIEISQGENKISSFVKFIYRIIGQTLSYSIGALEDILTELFGFNFDKINKFLYTIRDSFDDMFFNIVDRMTNGDGLKAILSEMVVLFGSLANNILEVFSDITGVDTETLKQKITDLVNDIFDAINSIQINFSILDKLKEKLDNIRNIINKIKDALIPFITAGKELIKNVLDKVFNYPWMTFSTIFSAKMIWDIVSAIKDTQKAFPGFIASFIDMKDKVCGVFDAVTDTLKTMQEQVKSKLIIAIAAGVAILAVSLLLISTIDTDKIHGAMIALGSIMTALVVAVTKLEQASNKLSTSGTAKLGIAVIGVAASIYILAQALKQIASIGDFESIGESLIAMFFLFLYIAGMLIVLDSMEISNKQITKMMLIGIVAEIIGSAVKKLAEALSIIGSIDADKILDSFIVLGAGLLGLIKAIQELEGTQTEGLIKTAISMYLIATAMKVLASAINEVDTSDPLGLAEAFIIVGASLAAMCAAMNKIAGTKVLISTAIAMIAIALAVKILIGAIRDLTSYSGADLAKAWVVMAGTFAVIAIMCNLLQASLLKAGIGFLFVAIALKIVVNALDEMGKLDFTKMALDMALLVVAVYALAGIAFAASTALPGAVAILAISAALLVMSIALKVMEGLDLANMAVQLMMIIVAMNFLVGIAAMAQAFTAGAVALIAMSAAFTIFAIGCRLLAEADPMNLFANLITALLGFAAMSAIMVIVATVFATLAGQILIGSAVFLAAIAMISLGIALFAGAMTLLSLASSMFVVGSAGLCESLVLLSATFKQHSSTLAIGGAALLALGIGAFIAGIGAAALAIGGAAITVVVIALAIALTALAGSIALLNLALGAFATNGKAAGEALVNMTSDMVKSTPGLIAAGAEMLLLKPTLEKLTKMFVSFTNSAVLLGDSMITMNTAFTQFNGSVIQLAAAGEIFQTTMTKMSLTVTTAITQLQTSLVEGSNKIFAKATIAFQKIGANLIIGFIRGMNSNVAKAYATLSAMANRCIAITRNALGVHSPSKVFAEIGKYTVEGFANGLSDTKSSDDAAESMGESAINSLQAAMSSAYDNLDSDISDPVIKPVMDLSDVQNGSTTLDAMLSRDRATSINANYRTKRSYEEEDAANNATLMTNLNNKLLGAISSNGEEQSPFNINVVLEGNAGEIFRLVRVENERYVKSAGYSPLLR